MKNGDSGILFHLLFYNARIDFNHWTFVKFFIDNIYLFGLLFLSGFGLLFPMLQRRGAKVSTLEATQLINQSNPLILDVREPAEFAVAHVRNAKSVPLSELPKRIDELSKFKNTPVIVMCKSGERASSATMMLRKAGFEQASSLDGGLESWLSQGLPTVK